MKGMDSPSRWLRQFPTSLAQRREILQVNYLYSSKNVNGRKGQRMESTFWQVRRKVLDEYCQRHRLLMHDRTALAAAEWLIKFSPEHELRYETLLTQLGEAIPPATERNA